MSRHASKRYVKHQYEKSALAMEYRLREAPPKAKAALKAGDSRVASVQLLRTAPLHGQELIREIAGGVRRTLSPELVTYVLSSFREVALRALKQGRHVSLDDFFSIRPSLVGRIDPMRPYDARHLPLAASVRFSQTFHRDLNKDVKIHYAPGLQPTQIEIKSIEHFDCSHWVEGTFHNTQTLEVKLQEGDRITPCEVELSKKEKSKRDYGHILHLYHVGHNPTSPYTLRFTWITATGEEKSETHHL